MHKPRSPLIFIFLTVLIDLLGVGIVVPLLPFYVKLIEASSPPWIVANHALIVGALTASFALFQFLFAPVLGALSDRFGRRPVLLTSLLGTASAYILFGLAERFMPLGPEAVLAVLFVARTAAGITGGSVSTAQAYIADVTTPENRARGLGMLGAAFGLGFMLGPAIGGLLSTVSLSAPAFAAAALTLANVVFGFFNLPESLPADRRTTRLTSINPLRRLQVVLGRTAIRPLLLGVLLLNLAFSTLQSNFAVFSTVRFGYGPPQIAMIFAFIGLLAVVTQGFLLRRLVPRFGEARLALTGMALMTGGFALITVVPSAWLLYPALGLLAVGSSLATPSLTSLISRRVSAHEQGGILGGTQSLTSLMLVVGPLMAGLLFDTVGPTAPYLSSAILITAAAGVLFIALRPEFSNGPTAPQPTPLQAQVGALGD